MQDLSPIYPPQGEFARGVVPSPASQQFTPPLPSSQRLVSPDDPAWSGSNPASFGEPRRMEPGHASSSDGQSDGLDLRASWSSQGSITPAIPMKRRTRGSMGEKVVTTPRQATRGNSKSVSKSISSSKMSKISSNSRLSSLGSVNSKKSTTHKKRLLHRVHKTVCKPTAKPKVCYVTPCHIRALQLRATFFLAF